MLVVFADAFPARYKKRVQRLVEKYAEIYDLQNGWEVYVTTEVAADASASVDCSVQSHSIQLDLTPQRMKNLKAVEADIAHELWHILYWRTASVIEQLPLKYRKAASAAFEEDHDAASRVWLRSRNGKGPEG